MLNLAEGGQLGRNFAAVGSTMNIVDGIVDAGLEIAGSDMNISGGLIGPDFRVYADSTVDVSGGQIDALHALQGSVIEISGGQIGAPFRADAGSHVDLFGTMFAVDGVDITSQLVQWCAPRPG